MLNDVGNNVSFCCSNTVPMWVVAVCSIRSEEIVIPYLKRRLGTMNCDWDQWLAWLKLHVRMLVTNLDAGFQFFFSSRHFPSKCEVGGWYKKLWNEWCTITVSLYIVWARSTTQYNLQIVSDHWACVEISDFPPTFRNITYLSHLAPGGHIPLNTIR